MRQGPPNGRRPRGRHHSGGENRDRGGNGNGGVGGGIPRDNRPRSASSLRHQSFDSNCGDLRVRGNAWQVFEKYQALARDATSGGDRVSAENYLQHAEHYFRIIEAINEATASEQRAQGGMPGERAPVFGQQPEIPANYYGAPSPVQPVGGEPNGNAVPSPPQPEAQPMAEATVSQRNPPPSPFFTQEELEDHRGGQPLAAAR